MTLPDEVPAMRNGEIADQLQAAAELLEQQRANPFRVRAYRRAAETVELLEEPVAELTARAGVGGLVALPAVGHGIAQAIEEMLRTGRWGFLERLRGTLDPVALFRVVPGLGPELAARIHDQLHVDTLEALEAAAHDGRLETVAGIGPRRAAGVRATLDSMLGRGQRRRSPPPHRPGVDLLLEVDRVYREKGADDLLPTIAPRRFNPQAESWLPVLHTDLGGWHFTALFSNTARAHRLQRIGDWVVIYHYDDQHEEGQHTIVTERGGTLAGRRVVRGREAECRRWYEARSAGDHTE